MTNHPFPIKKHIIQMLVWIISYQKPDPHNGLLFTLINPTQPLRLAPPSLRSIHIHPCEGTSSPQLLASCL